MDICPERIKKRERERERTYLARKKKEKITNKKRGLNSVIESKRRKGCEVNKGEIQKAEREREIEEREGVCVRAYI